MTVNIPLYVKFDIQRQRGRDAGASFAWDALKLVTQRAAEFPIGDLLNLAQRTFATFMAERVKWYAANNYSDAEFDVFKAAAQSAFDEMLDSYRLASAAGGKPN